MSFASSDSALHILFKARFKGIGTLRAMVDYGSGFTFFRLLSLVVSTLGPIRFCRLDYTCNVLSSFFFDSVGH